MKNETTFAKKLATHLKRIRPAAKVEAPPKRDPVTQMVIAFLEWNATPKMARDAYARIMAGLVDNNDLRVSHPHEVMELLGSRYPRAEERAARMHESLQEIFVREHSVGLEELSTKPKKQIRTYLDTLPGMTSFVATHVMLYCFGVHGIPVDDTLADLLRQEGIVDETATIDEISGFLERNVKAGEAPDVHHALQAWCAATAKPAPTPPPQAPRPAAAKPAAKPAPSARPPAKPAKKAPTKR